LPADSFFFKILILSYISASIEINCGGGTEVDMSILKFGRRRMEEFNESADKGNQTNPRKAWMGFHVVINRSGGRPLFPEST
jgi:hypothetical protein